MIPEEAVTIIFNDMETIAKLCGQSISKPEDDEPEDYPDFDASKFPERW